MFTRRMFVALAVCLAVSASSAFANGNGGGTKKDSHIKVKNESQHDVYAFVDVNIDDIQEAAFGDGETGDPLADFQGLGGKLVESGGEADFSVKAGAHRVTVIDVNEETGGPVFVDRRVSVAKGQTKKVFVHDTDLPVDAT